MTVEVVVIVAVIVTMAVRVMSNKSGRIDGRGRGW